MRPVAWISAGVAAWALSSGTGPGRAVAQEYDVDRGADRNVRFISTTQVNEFEGVTDRIDGYVVLPGTPLAPGMPTEGSKLYFEVDLASLDTGIDLRNRHMREDYLEVEKHPYARFSGGVERVETGEDGGLRVTAAGTMSIHGIDKDMRLPCDVHPEGKGYRAQCAFDLLLSDFGVSIPKLMFLKLANDVRLEVAFTTVPAGDGRDG